MSESPHTSHRRSTSAATLPSPVPVTREHKAKLNAIFKELKVSSFPLPRSTGVLEVPSDASVTKALQILNNNNILAVPVRNTTPGIPLARVEAKTAHQTPPTSAAVATASPPSLSLGASATTPAATATATSSPAVATPTVASPAAATATVATPASPPLHIRVPSFTPSVPLHAVAGKWIDNYLGLISMFDIVAFVLGTVRKTAGFGKGFEQVMESVEIFSHTNVRTLLEHSERTPLVPLPADSHIFDVLLALGKYRNHRVVIVDGDRMVNMITQSAMVRFLRASLENPVLAAHANRSLHDLGLSADKPVISVPLTARAIDAFQIIHRKRVSGVPVVDANGVIVGNISARDVRSMVNRPAVFERIYDTVTEFLAAIHDEAELKGGVDRAPAVCCRRTDTLVSILDKFITLGIHRVYVVDDRKRPTSVISLTDVIAAFATDPDDLSRPTPPASPALRPISIATPHAH